MADKWKVLLYKSPKGEVPVNNFIFSLELKTQAKIYKAFEFLKILGTTTASPHFKKLEGTNLWELRILGSDNIRLLYVAITDKFFLILHGFKKKTNKTPNKEIKIAENRLLEFTTRK